MSTDTNWSRYPRTNTAVRGDSGERITIMGQRGGWVAMVGTNSVMFDPGAEASLDDAIDVVDTLFPPPGWTRSDDCRTLHAEEWSRVGWTVAKGEDGPWRVWRSASPSDDAARVQATTKTFKSADRARKWAEIRLDRTSANLRGPRPRAADRAVRTLPDVRVTEQERADAVALAERLGLSFSDLARAALTFIKAHTEAEGTVQLERAGTSVKFKLR